MPNTSRKSQSSSPILSILPGNSFHWISSTTNYPTFVHIQSCLCPLGWTMRALVHPKRPCSSIHDEESILLLIINSQLIYLLIGFLISCNKVQINIPWMFLSAYHCQKYRSTAMSHLLLFKRWHHCIQMLLDGPTPLPQSLVSWTRRRSSYRWDS